MEDKHFLAKETENLIKQWESYDQELLADYLVQSLQDPRINPQSILARLHIADGIADGKLHDMAMEELAWAFDANRMLREYEKEHGVSVHNLSAIKSDLPENKLYQTLYKQLFDEQQKEWQARWVRELAPYAASARKPTVIEAACGAANDYRFLDAYGFGRAIRYKGFDLNAANVATAQKRHPEATFVRGNILDMDEADKSWDIMVIHDLFEHLHIDACRVAMKEAMRVTRDKIVISYFSMDEIEDHRIKPIKHYHWNTLSRVKMAQEWRDLGAQVESTHINSLASKYGFSEFHNERAYTFVVTPS